ncbi:MAG: type II toxin-antitoxin system VapC family toxin [Isosphaeraceae bacterium]
MATVSPSKQPCLTVDSNVLIAICAKEAGRHTLAHAELTAYATQGYEFYAPGLILGECLYVLCRKLELDGTLTPAEHAAAVADLSTYMGMILPPPNGEASLVIRAEQIRSGYGCSRSADGIFLALAEELAATRTCRLLTFDTGFKGQARTNAPIVDVHELVTPATGTPPPASPPTPAAAPSP